MMRLLSALVLAAWSLQCHALDGNDELRLSLTTGETVEGWFYDLRGDVVLLSGDNRIYEVPLALITAVIQNDEERSLVAFQVDLDEVRALRTALLADPPPHPRQGVVIALSFGWAGAGHAALGDWKSFAGYSVVEAAILGTAGYNIARGSDLGVLVPLTGLDLLFKGYAAGDAARLSRSRREGLGLRKDRRPTRIEQGLDHTTQP